MTRRPRKSLHTLSEWLGGDLIDLLWSAATVAVVLAGVWTGFIH